MAAAIYTSIYYWRRATSHVTEKSFFCVKQMNFPLKNITYNLCRGVVLNILYFNFLDSYGQQLDLKTNWLKCIGYRADIGVATTNSNRKLIYYSLYVYESISNDFAVFPIKLYVNKFIRTIFNYIIESFSETIRIHSN